MQLPDGMPDELPEGLSFWLVDSEYVAVVNSTDNNVVVLGNLNRAAVILDPDLLVNWVDVIQCHYDERCFTLKKPSRPISVSFSLN